MSADPGNLPISWQITIIVITIILSGIVALSNTAMESVGRTKVRQMAEEDREDKRAENLRILVEKPSRYRYCNRLLNYLLVFTGLLCIFDMPLPVSPWIVVLLYVFVLISMAEMFPRKLARQHALPIARRFAGIQLFLGTLLSPFTGSMMFVANIFLKLFGQETNVSEEEYSEDEIMSILEVGQQNGALMEEGKRMIGSIFEFDDELAYEIMTPRTDVFMIDIEDSPEEYIDQLMEMRYTRMPVCEGDSDNIIGTLHIKDYLIKAWQDGFDKVDIRSILRKPYFVPETKKINTLFIELQQEKQHIAILIDEYGGFSGIVTMEDIVEEIVGDIDDEYDEENEVIERLSTGDYLVDGNVDLDDLNEELGTDLESDTSETIGGFIIDILGEIPGDGYVRQTIEYGKYSFTILSVKERRIEKIKMHIEPEEDEQSGNDEERRRESR